MQADSSKDRHGPHYRFQVSLHVSSRIPFQYFRFSAFQFYLSMPSRPPHAIAATLALLAVMTVLFAPALFQGKLLAPLDITTSLLPPWGDPAGPKKPHNQSPSDAVTQYLPYRMFAEESLRKDGYIGWNPYEMGGYSLAANTMALPGSWPLQLHRWLSFKDAWNLGIIGEFLIAGIGMLVFLRGRKLPWLPCLIGAVAFMFNAQFIIWIYHRWALGSFCWMPWVLWAFGDGFSTRPRPRRLFLLPAFLALALLGGSLQHAAFIILACGCLTAAHFNFRRPLQNASALLGWMLAFVLALGMAAFSLIPQIQGYLANIAIGHVRGSLGYENGFSQILLNTVLIPARIWPWLAGDPQTMDAWRLLKSGFMSLNYLGTIPMLLGFAGLFVRSMPRPAKWLIIVGLLTPLTPLVGPLYHRVELLFILGAAWMTAEMLGFLADTHPSKKSTAKNSQPTTNNPQPTASRVSQACPRILIAAVSAIGLVLLVGTLLPDDIRGKLEQAVVSKAVARSADSKFGADQEWIDSRAREWTHRFSLTHPRTAWVYGLLVLGTTGLLFFIPRNIQHSKSKIQNLPPHISRPVGHLLILTATTLELGTLFHTWTTYSDRADLRPQHPAIDTIRSLAGPHRVLQRSPDADFVDMFATPNLLASFAIPSIDSYESIQYRSPVIALRDASPDLQLDLAGVALAVHPADKPAPDGTASWGTTPLSPQHTLRSNPAPLPPIAIGQGQVPTTPEAILTALTNACPITPTHQTPNRLHIPLSPQEKQKAESRKQTPPIQQPATRNQQPTTNNQPSEIGANPAFNIQHSNSRTWLRISQNWHPGWKWRTEGKLWKPFTNGLDAACWITHLPAGASQLEVQFFPRPIWLTMASFGSIIAWLGIACAVRASSV